MFHSLTIRNLRLIILFHWYRSNPPFHDVANAVGAAIASISGDMDTIVTPPSPNPTPDEMRRLVDEVKLKATKQAVEKGAKAETVKVVRVEVVPLAYIATGAVRVIVKAVGELGSERIDQRDEEGENKGNGAGEFRGEDEHQGSIISGGTGGEEIEAIDYEVYTPKVVGDEWMISETDLRMS